MAVIADMMRFVTRRIRRPDLNEQLLEHSIDVYRTICGVVPFMGLQAKSNELVIPSNGVIDLSSFDPPILGLMSVRLTVSTGQTRRLQRSNTRVYDALGYQKPGIPALYARFGDTIEVQPLPNSTSYTIRFRYWVAPTINANPNEAQTALLWPAAWDSLGKYETLYRTYIDLDEHEKAAWLMQPPMIPRQAAPRKVRSFETGIIPRLWNDLLKTEPQREEVDEDYGINPIVRNYGS